MELIANLGAARSETVAETVEGRVGHHLTGWDAFRCQKIAPMFRQTVAEGVRLSIW